MCETPSLTGSHRSLFLRVLVQNFWDTVLPLVSERLNEFTLPELISILQAASKPFVGKKSVVRVLAGYTLQAFDLLEKTPRTDPKFEEYTTTLKEILPRLFEKQELKSKLEERFEAVLEGR